MLIFVYGQDRYRIRKYTSNLLEVYSNKYPNRLDISKFDAEEGLDGLVELVSSTSLFDDRKFTVLTGVFFNKNLAEDFLFLVKNNNGFKDSDRIIVINGHASEESLKKTNKNLFQYLESNSKSIKEFNFLTQPALKKWIRSQLVVSDINLDSQLVDYLVQIGPDLGRLSNEILKLKFYQSSSTRKLGLNDIDSLVERPGLPNDFSMVEDLIFGRLASGLSRLDKYVRNDGDPSRFLGLLSYQLKALLMVHECLEKNMRLNEISKKTGLHPFVVKKLSSQVNGGIISRTRDFLNALPVLDRQIKSGVSLTEAIISTMLNKN